MVVLFAFCTLAASAQDANEQDRPTNKDGKQILPVKGDIGIGIQATPFFNYAGNFFGKTSNNGSPSFTSLSNSINVKKFLDNNTAVRVSLNLQKSGNTRVYGDTRDDNASTDPLNTAQVTDKIKSANYQNAIGVSLEKRRGYGRLQGFYGAGVSLSFTNSKSEYTYGNQMSSSNPSPSTYGTGTRTTRTLESADNAAGIGASGFLGVEYFVARKISVQGEFGWGFNYNYAGSSESSQETMLNGERTVYTRNTGDDAIKSFTYGNNVSSQLGIFFHF